MRAWMNNNRQEGQGLVEYALILTLVSVVVIIVLVVLGPTIGNVFSNVVTELETMSGGGGGGGASPTAAPLSAGCQAINGYNQSYNGDLWPGSDMEYNAGEVVTFTVTQSVAESVDLYAVIGWPNTASVGSTTGLNYTVSYTIPTTQNYRWWADRIGTSNVYSVSISCS